MAGHKRLSRFVNVHRSQLGHLLVRQGHIQQPELDKALRIQQSSHKVLPKILIEMGLVDEAVIIKAIQCNQEINVGQFDPSRGV